MERGEKLIEEDKHTRLDLTSQTLQNITRFFDDLNWYSENEAAAINFWKNYLQIVDKELIQDIKEILESSDINIPIEHYDTFILVCNELVIYQQCFWKQIGVIHNDSAKKYAQQFQARFKINNDNIPDIVNNKKYSDAANSLKKLIATGQEIVRIYDLDLESDYVKIEVEKIVVGFTKKDGTYESRNLAVPNIDETLSLTIVKTIIHELQKFDLEEINGQTFTQLRNRYSLRSKQLFRFLLSIDPKSKKNDKLEFIGKLLNITEYGPLKESTNNRKNTTDNIRILINL